MPSDSRSGDWPSKHKTHARMLCPPTFFYPLSFYDFCLFISQSSIKSTLLTYDKSEKYFLQKDFFLSD